MLDCKLYGIVSNDLSAIELNAGAFGVVCCDSFILVCVVACEEEERDKATAAALVFSRLLAGVTAAKFVADALLLSLEAISDAYDG